MSYRISFSGYNHAKLRDLLGSGDAAAIARLHARIDSANRCPDPSVRQLCKEIVSRAITDGVPFDDLDAESYAHTWAALLLAEDQQIWHTTDCSYHWTSVGEFRRRAAQHARPDVRAFITGLNQGIGMFGQRFADTQSSYYASFELAKVVSFREGLQELREVMTLPSTAPLSRLASNYS